MDLTLREIVNVYRGLTGGFGKPAALEKFALSKEDIERTFGGFDDDYHISRYLHFSLDPEAKKKKKGVYDIGGFPQSHISIDAEIEEVL